MNEDCSQNPETAEAEQLTGHKLFNEEIDALLRNPHSQEVGVELPTIKTRTAPPFAPVLAVHLAEQEGVIWNPPSNRAGYLEYVKHLKACLDDIEQGKVQSHMELVTDVKVASKIIRKDLPSAMFDLMYGALQFYSYWPNARYSELFNIVSGIVYTAGERANFRQFHQHVDHFKCHAAVFLSAGSTGHEWREVLDRAVLLLEEWGDQQPPESIMVHAAHNLYIRCAGLPTSDFAYDLIKDLRKQHREGTITEEAVFDVLNEKVGFMEAFEIMKILWGGMPEKYYIYVKKTVHDIADKNEAIEYVQRMKFFSPLQIPYVRTSNGRSTPDAIVVSFPGGSAIGKTCTLLKYGGRRIMIDYGCDTFGKLPKWSPDVDLLDHVLITHAHQDHIGGLLHLYKTQGYAGKWWALAESKDLIALSLKDSVKIGISELGDDAPFSVADVDRVLANFEPIQEKEEHRLDDRLSFKAFPAGHVHGSCQYLIKSGAGSPVYHRRL